MGVQDYPKMIQNLSRISLPKMSKNNDDNTLATSNDSSDHVGAATLEGMD